jgi:N-acetylglucosamine repressor
MIFRNSTGKATHGQLRQHNRQLLLRAIYQGVADNRAALAQQTGLAKPTVSELIGELIEESLLVEEGLGQSTEEGGKRPRLLKFVPNARHVIGVSVNDERVLGALATLDGQIVARHYIDLDGIQGEAILPLLHEVINGLLAQLDAPLLCIGVGVSGLVDADEGIVHYAPHLDWNRVPLAQLLSEEYGVPVHVANSTELAAMGQYFFGQTGSVSSLAAVRVGSGVGVGLVIKGAIYHGGGEIGYLRVAEYKSAGGGEDRLETFLSWPHVKRRAYELRADYPGSLLPQEGLTYLHIRCAAANGDLAALALHDELSHYLAQVFAWIIGLLRPEHVSLAGPITDLGEPLLDQIVSKTRQLILPELTQKVTFSLMESSQVVAVGAIAQALQLELGLV